MKRMLAIALIGAMSSLVLLISGLTVKPSVASACSCAVPSSVEDTLEWSAAVFQGTVASILDRNEGAAVRSSGDPLEVTFEVDEAWKGEVSAEMVVTTPMSSASCGFTFLEGVTYLVYASETQDGGLQTLMCGRTTQASNASADLAELGPGKMPEPPPASSGAETGAAGAADNGAVSPVLAKETERDGVPVYGLALAGVALLGVVVLIMRRLRR